MTEFPADGTGAHVAGALGMSGSGHLAEGADVFWALGTDVVSRSALKTLDLGG